jgi:hypothetical protein
MSQKFSNNQLFKMKKLLFILAIVVATASIANAQDKKWNIGFGAGMASPMGSDLKDVAKVGADYYVNCTYNFTPKMSAGIEYNGTGLIGATIGDTDNKIGALGISSYLAKGVYYFTESAVRPYGALMTGIYSSKFASTDYNEAVSKTNFGFGAELGLKIKWFNLSVAYQNAGKINDISVSYMQYNLGFNIGF